MEFLPHNEDIAIDNTISVFLSPLRYMVSDLFPLHLSIIDLDYAVHFSMTFRSVCFSCSICMKNVKLL